MGHIRGRWLTGIALLATAGAPVEADAGPPGADERSVDWFGSTGVASGWMFPDPSFAHHGRTYPLVDLAIRFGLDIPLGRTASVRVGPAVDVFQTSRSGSYAAGGVAEVDVRLRERMLIGPRLGIEYAAGDDVAIRGLTLLAGARLRLGNVGVSADVFRFHHRLRTGGRGFLVGVDVEGRAMRIVSVALAGISTAIAAAILTR